MKKEELSQRRDELAPWPTSIYLGQGVWTAPLTNEKDNWWKGNKINMIKTNWYVDTMEWALGGLQDKRVLDIGSNSGYVALEAALRGAKVVSIEPHPQNYLRCEFVYQARGVLDKNVILTKDDMEAISFDTLGRFDGIFFCGTIYHCSSPWEVLKRYSKMTDVILVESRLALENSVNETKDKYRFKKMFEPANSPLHRVTSGTVRHPTRHTLYQMVKDAGFSNIYQLMPADGLTPKYQQEECVAFLANKRPPQQLKLTEIFDG